MKRYKDLTPEEQKKAREKALVKWLELILECGIRFDDKANHDDLQARIDAACEEADRMYTPWFAHEYILDTCRADLEDLAIASAEDAFYPEPGETILYIEE